MKTGKMTLDSGEQIRLALRELYRTYGYSQYKMSKFEEYDLYAHNKEFLTSESILTFTDMSGKLMALKPDVTLSIVRSSQMDPQAFQKVYYTENVYRATKESGFKEIMQAGVECMGPIDDYYLSEVITLAAESLQCISRESVLSISNLDLISDAMKQLNVSGDAEEQLIDAIAHKNIHELYSVGRQAGAEEQALERLAALVQIRGDAEEVLSKLKQWGCQEAILNQLATIYQNVKSAGLDTEIRFDMSLISNLRYYNGLVFCGYVSNVPVSVLNGGQYNRLMKKMRRSCGAIGFAVYLDALEHTWKDDSAYDVDVVLLYDDQVNVGELYRKVQELIESGVSVMAMKQKPEKLKYKLMVRFSGSEVEALENNA